MSNEIAQEDVKSIGLAAMATIESELKKFEIVITDADEDRIYEFIVAEIDKLAGCPDYRHHN